MHKWANAVLTPIHTVAVTPVHIVAIRKNRTVLQGRDNAVCTYVRTDTQIPKQKRSMYAGGGTWKTVRKKDGQMN